MTEIGIVTTLVHGVHLRITDPDPYSTCGGVFGEFPQSMPWRLWVAGFTLRTSRCRVSQDRGVPDDDEGGSSAGAAFLFRGPITADRDLSLADAKLLGEDVEHFAGESVAGAGDVDDDGFADILVGTSRNHQGGVDADAAYLLCGPITGDRDLSLADVKLTSEVAEDYAGQSVAGAGDVDGDGFADILVGAVGNDEGGSSAGAAYLIYGPVTTGDNLYLADAKLVGEDASDMAGSSVSGAGDVNGDSLDDILVGAAYNDEGGSMAGAAYLLYGPVTADRDLGLADAKLIGEEASDLAGISVSGAGDVDGDGFTDILVGAADNDDGGNKAGVAYLLYGPVTANRDLSLADAKLVGVASGDNAGESVSGAGDVNADGFSDVLAGAPGYAGSHVGAAYLLYGGTW